MANEQEEALVVEGIAGEKRGCDRKEQPIGGDSPRRKAEGGRVVLLGNAV